MSILNSILKVFLGDKSGKDLKKVTPLVDKINDYYISLEKMSNDSLRDKTNSFKKKIEVIFNPDSRLQAINLLKKEVTGISQKEES